MSLYIELVPPDARGAFERAAEKLRVLERVIGFRSMVEESTRAIEHEIARAHLVIGFLLRAHADGAVTVGEVKEVLEYTADPLALMIRAGTLDGRRLSALEAMAIRARQGSQS